MPYLKSFENFSKIRHSQAFHFSGLSDSCEGISKINKKELSEKLAEILDNVNFLHPFREGNGRAQREFIRSLALEKKLKLNLNPPDNPDVYNRYMEGTINSDVKILTKLIFDLIKE